MTLAEQEADVIAAEQAAKAETEGSAVVTPVEEKQTPEPAKIEQSPAPAITTPSEVESLKASMAEKEARISELTKRVRDEDGRRGGELNTLRDQIGRLGDQLRDLMSENRELRGTKPAAPAVPAEPDTLETEFPDVAKGVDRRTKPAVESAARAEKTAGEVKAELERLKAEAVQAKYDGFLKSIETVVPRMTEINDDPEFKSWCLQRDPDTGIRRQSILNECSSAMDPEPVIKLFQKWEKSKITVAQPPVPEPQKGPAKPAKEDQVAVPPSSAQPGKPKPVNLERRIKEIEDKVFRFGTATAADRAEYDRLLDAQARGENT